MKGEWHMEHPEQRNGMKVSPYELQKHMSEEQRNTFHNLELHGWQCKFVRRPLFQKSVCIVINQEKTQLAVIEEDGTFNKQLDIPLRSADN
jgi:hypothetical protein